MIENRGLSVQSANIRASGLRGCPGSFSPPQGLMDIYLFPYASTGNGCTGGRGVATEPIQEWMRVEAYGPRGVRDTWD